MLPTLVFVTVLAWLTFLGAATTRCLDLSLVSIEIVGALLITIVITIYLLPKGKK